MYGEYQACTESTKHAWGRALLESSLSLLFCPLPPRITFAPTFAPTFAHTYTAHRQFMCSWCAVGVTHVAERGHCVRFYTGGTLAFWCVARSLIVVYWRNTRVI